MVERDFIPISALQHWCYCPRQCALIHVEQVFADNLHTLRGQAVHRQVDQPGVETRAGLRVERALPVWSDRLGLIGKADVVEFEPDGTAHPVEYKVGNRAKAAWIAACDDVQLAAQALCLEEMTGKPVPAGGLLYPQTKRPPGAVTEGRCRRGGEGGTCAGRGGIDTGDSGRVEEATAAVRAMIDAGAVPPPTNDARCAKCSLADLCQPAMRRAITGLFDPDA